MAEEVVERGAGDRMVELRTGDRVPSICFGGGARIRDGHVFEEALSAGYRFFDTAVTYGNDHLLFSSERGRRLVAEGREGVVVCSKASLWNPLPDTVQEALGRMGVQYLDLLLLHHPVHPKDDDPLGTLRRTWRAMEQLVDDGRVRMLGLSNTGSSLLRFVLDFCRIPPLVDQVELHPYAQDRELLAACGAAGIRIQAYCPLGSPWRQAERGKEPPTVDPVVMEIARSREKAPSQVILRWHMDKGVIPVVSATKADHMRQNLDVFDFELSRSERDAIEALDRQDRIWRDPVKLAGLFGEVRDGELQIPEQWPA
jgi:diketogulonate reductase-like aldo/keto reductase